MKVVAAFPFFNELDLLEVHLATLNEVVDHFVITEARFSHAGKRKPLYLKENIHRFSDYKSKITIQVVEEYPEGVTNFEADWFQREQAKVVLNDLMHDDDYLVYGDVDEIARPKKLSLAIQELEKRPDIEVAHFAQDLFYYAVNVRETSGTLLSYMGEYEGVQNKKWLGTTLNRWTLIKDNSLTSLRNPERKAKGIRVSDGGWHFSWIGSADESSVIDRVKMKLENTAHQEFKSVRNMLLLERRLRNLKDLVGRRGAKFELIEGPQDLPEFLVENKGRFEHLFLGHDRD